MVTKLPVSGKLVASSGRARRGMALVSVVAVLVLLAIVTTPFLVTMRDSAARGERFLYSARADWEAESLFEMVRSHLTTSIEHIERRRLDDAQDGANSRPGAGATPTSDTMGELQLPQALLDRLNTQSSREHRVWDVDIIDLQGKLNLNSCSIGALGNILGTSELADVLGADDNRIPVTDAGAFPKDGGVVRIGTEVIKYDEVGGNELLGCERGFKSDLSENSSPQEWEPGDIVVLEAAFQIATRPFRIRPGAYVRYTNVYQARTISRMGVAALSPDLFDVMRPFVTAWNGDIVGDGWSNPQPVRNAITSADASQRYADIKNNRYFGRGTIVRITDGVNNDYAVVTKVRGSNQILLSGNITHDYSADLTRIYARSRAPLNVNTADAETLAIVFRNLRIRGRSSSISAAKAVNLANFLKEFTVGDETEPGIYRNWEDFITAMEFARDEAGVVSGDEYNAVVLNAMNANDSLLAFSTVPFVFRSFDTYEVRATAAIMDATGRELSRRDLRRVMIASSTRSGTFEIETQDDFQRQIMKSRDGKWFATFPNNINAYYDGLNIPASEYFAFSQKSRFPSTDRSPGVGDVRLIPAAYRFSQRDTPDRVYHFDGSDLPDGLDLEEQTLTMSLDGPYSVNDNNADLVDFADIPNLANDVELGLKEFAFSLWYRPGWSRGEGDQVIFDVGADSDTMNRCGLIYDNQRDVLALQVADATREQRVSEVFYDFDHTTWLADEWYHIGVHVGGGRSTQMELFIDGEKQGQANGITRLTASVASTGPILEIQVEDASTFPDEGVLLLRAPEGAELMEYSSRTEGSFQISRRKARTIETIDDDTEPRTHVEGQVVELYGFSGVLFSDLKTGGGTTGNAFGPFRVYRYTVDGPDPMDPNEVGRMIDLAGGALATVGIGSTAVLPITIQIEEWTTANDSTDIADDLGAIGTEGIAMLVSNRRVLPTGVTFVNQEDGTQQSVDVGGAELVQYRIVASGEVEITARGLSSRHWDFEPNGSDGLPRFHPCYSFSTTATGPTPLTGMQLQGQNAPEWGHQSAFIPVGIVMQGTGLEYLDPADEEPQVGGIAYVQIEGEWFKYDTIDDQIVPGRTVIYRDTRWDEIAGEFGVAGDLTATQVTQQQSAAQGQSGGTGGNASPDYTPPRAAAVNDENALPSEPSDSNNAAQYMEETPTILLTDIVDSADWRGMIVDNEDIDFRIANTIPADHASGEDVLPTFQVRAAQDLSGGDIQRDAAPGFNDLITLRDSRLNDEHVRVQWGYLGWVGLDDFTTQTWQWDRLQNNIDMRRFDARAFTRAMKFPSGELPDAGLTSSSDSFSIGVGYDGGNGVSPAVIDELYFADFNSPADDRPSYVFVGEVPQQISNPQFSAPAAGTAPAGSAANNDPRFDGIDDADDDITVHMPFYDPPSGTTILAGLPIDEDLFPDDGGVIRIEDELILYSEFDPDAGTFSGCLRGAFGTEPTSHEFGAILIPVHTFAATTLVSDMDESAGSAQLSDTRDFPDDGYVRINDGAELIGYTERDGNQISMPLGRIDPTTERDAGTDDARISGGIFRGRFGTTAEGYAVDDVVIAMPFRHYDRYSERSDDPENSYVQLSWTKPGAVWKRITWGEVPRNFVEVIALVRFRGGPAWDSADVIRVGQDMIPAEDRRKYLYEISDPTAENLINVEADRIEVRLQVRFAQGAYDRFAEVAPDNWKQSPWIQDVTVEYVAPPFVLYEDK